MKLTPRNDRAAEAFVESGNVPGSVMKTTQSSPADKKDSGSQKKPKRLFNTGEPAHIRRAKKKDSDDVVTYTWRFTKAQKALLSHAAEQEGFDNYKRLLDLMVWEQLEETYGSEVPID